MGYSPGLALTRSVIGNRYWDCAKADYGTLESSVLAKAGLFLVEIIGTTVR